MNDLMECQKEVSLNAIIIGLFKAYWMSSVILGAWLCLLPKPTMAANVNSSIQLVKAPVSYDAQTQTGTIEVTLQNTGTVDLSYPIKVAVMEIFYSLDNADLDGDGDVDGKDLACFNRLTGTPDEIALADFIGHYGRTDILSATETDLSDFQITNSAGSTPEGLPYWVYPAQETGQVLAPGEETDPLAWQVHIPVDAFQACPFGKPV
nr:hypothetical protein [uncultured Desulfobacter sp.]